MNDREKIKKEYWNVEMKLSRLAVDNGFSSADEMFNNLDNMSLSDCNIVHMYAQKRYEALRRLDTRDRIELLKNVVNLNDYRNRKVKQ